MVLPIQTGALPWRKSDKKVTVVLLVTGRQSGRWMVPKGWPMPGKSLAKAAAQEAFEEAGVCGSVDSKPLGTFRHIKEHLPAGMLEVSIVVHLLAVDRELEMWPEHGQRQRKWFTIEQAVEQVDSKKLGKIILQLGKRVARS